MKSLPVLYSVARCDVKESAAKQLAHCSSSPCRRCPWAWVECGSRSNEDLRHLVLQLLCWLTGSPQPPFAPSQRLLLTVQNFIISRIGDQTAAVESPVQVSDEAGVTLEGRGAGQSKQAQQHQTGVAHPPRMTPPQKCATHRAPADAPIFPAALRDQVDVDKIIMGAQG